VQGLLNDTKFDYQASVFRINIKDKLTQLSDISGGTNYSYFANTGDQRNQGLELSLGYVYSQNDSFIKTIRPFANWSYYDFKYTNYNLGANKDYDHKTVVGVPRNKVAIGLDFDSKVGIYLNNTFSYLGGVYSDFANTNLVKGYTQYNAKLGYKISVGKFDFDVYAAGNNLTNQINYTFLFLGNNINDSDANSNYPGQKTDINAGPKNAYFFGGANIKFHF
jgi:iron complex outermembrane receptor protein